MRRLIPVLVAVALVAGIAYAFWPKPIPVDMEKVEQGPLVVTVDEEGKTRIKERYIVSAPLAGQLRRIELDPGDPVAAGKTLLAVIEPTDPALLDERTLAETEARVKAAEANVAQAQTAVDRAKVALEYAQNDYRRTRSLHERKQATQAELEQNELLVRTRTEDLRASEFQLQIAQFELEQARAALLRASPSGNPMSAEERKIEIRSPIDGKVLRLFQESAAVVAPGTQLLEVGDPRDLEVEVDVLSSDAVKITRGAKVLLEHWGGPKPLEGRVRRVEPAGFTKISALGVEEQRVNVIIDFEGPYEERETLGDAFRVEARIIVWEGENVVKVPAGALFRVDQDWAVFRVNGHRAHLTKIKIGEQNPDAARVIEGLTPGQIVISHPSDKITDGVRVTAR
jgi:HlyD family secretion protein